MALKIPQGNGLNRKPGEIGGQNTAPQAPSMPQTPSAPQAAGRPAMPSPSGLGRPAMPQAPGGSGTAPAPQQMQSPAPQSSFGQAGAAAPRGNVVDPLGLPTNASPIQRVIALTERLTQHFLMETEFVRKAQPARLAEHEELRNHLVKAYESALQTIKENPSLVTSASDAEKTRLKQATQEMQRAAEAEENQIKAAKKVTENVLEGFRAAAQDASEHGMAYNNRGIMPTRNATRNVTHNVKPIALHRVI